MWAPPLLSGPLLSVPRNAWAALDIVSCMGLCTRGVDWLIWGSGWGVSCVLR